MAFKHGKNTKVLLNEYDLSSYFSDGSVSSSVETGETTSYGNSAKTYIVGLSDSTLSLSGFWDGAANAVDEVISAALQTDAEVITFAPEGLSAGSRLYAMKSLATSYEVSSPVADVVKVTLEGQNTDRCDRGISLADLAAVSATGNSTAQDNTSSTASGGAGVLHVTANTHDGNATFKIQHSADNSVWADLITFSVVATTIKTAEHATVTGTVNRYLRVQYTLAGSTGSVTFHASFARR